MSSGRMTTWASIGSVSTSWRIGLRYRANGPSWKNNSIFGASAVPTWRLDSASANTLTGKVTDASGRIRPSVIGRATSSSARSTARSTSSLVTIGTRNSVTPLTVPRSCARTCASMRSAVAS